MKKNLQALNAAQQKRSIYARYQVYLKICFQMFKPNKIITVMSIILLKK